MKTTVKKIYEAMFLVDSTEAATDWEGITGLITNILQRADAEVVTLKKWDDRKLAYAIGGKDRGTYILCYFKAPGAKVGEIERDVQLSERIMRVLILSAEGMSKDDIEKETPAGIAEKQGRKTAEAMEKPAGSTSSPPADSASPPAGEVSPRADLPEAGFREDRNL